MTGPAYQGTGRPDVHAERRSSPFGYHAAQLRLVVRELLEGARLPPDARVFDYGCADGPYRSDLPAGARYVGGDLPGNSAADVELRPDGTVPLPDASFDAVLSTQVLEHVADPGVHLAECHRLLDAGGSLVLSTHGIMYHHRDPEDYWRWTTDGLRMVLAERGFSVAEMRGVLALPAAALQLFQDGTLWKVPARLRRPYTVVMQTAIGFIDRRYEEATRLSNCLTIAARATKAATP